MSLSSGASVDLAAGGAAPAEQPLDVDELGHADRRAALAAQAAEHHVAHVLEGREDDGLARVEIAEALVRSHLEGRVF